MRSAHWPLRISVALFATASAFLACHDNIPGPMLPIAPEVSPQAPRPQPIEPRPMRIDHDAGVPLPSSPEPSALRTGRATQRVATRPAHVPPVDAGEAPGDVIDLPEVVDADLPIYDDAAQPLK